MQRSSPRASAGLSRLAASIAPSAAPAPTSVCSSSMKRMIWPCAASTSLSTALSRSSNSPRNFAPATSARHVERDEPLVLERLGHVAAHDALGDALDDGRLADARLADEHGVVLGAAREHLHHAADLLVAADDRDRSCPCARASVRSRVYFSSAWNFPSGSRSVTRWLPRTRGERREELVVADARRARSSAWTSRSAFAAASRKCSTETKSSLSAFASSSAFRRTVERAPREARLGAAADAREARRSSRRAGARALAGSAPAFWSERRRRRRRPARAIARSRCSG